MSEDRPSNSETTASGNAPLPTPSLREALIEDVLKAHPTLTREEAEEPNEDEFGSEIPFSGFSAVSVGPISNGPVPHAARLNLEAP